MPATSPTLPLRRPFAGTSAAVAAFAAGLALLCGLAASARAADPAEPPHRTLAEEFSDPLTTLPQVFLRTRSRRRASAPTAARTG
jgi:hypothetical protein